jgi:transaldolase
MTKAATQYQSHLHEMTQTTQSVLWNDSVAETELGPSIADGAVGATCNPVIVLDALKKEWNLWRPRIVELAQQMPTATEDEIAWRLVEEISSIRAKLLLPAFERYKGRNGRLSIQTDPRLFRNKQALIEQTRRFNGLGPNIIIKLPATEAGIAAMEEVTAEGISINATVSFSAPQCVAVAEAVERGLNRAEKAGIDISKMGPVCTIMVGRLDDWLKVIAQKKGIITDPGYLEWAGVAVFKRMYQYYRERGYRTRLLSAAFRNHMHWSEFIGGDVVISPPYQWQQLFNASDVEVKPRIETPVDPVIVKELSAKFPEFVRAYEPNGMTIPEFLNFGPTRRTLRQFLVATADLAAQIRNVLVPDPDAEL